MEAFWDRGLERRSEDGIWGSNLQEGGLEWQPYCVPGVGIEQGQKKYRNKCVEEGEMNVYTEVTKGLNGGQAWRQHGYKQKD